MLCQQQLLDVKNIYPRHLVEKMQSIEIYYTCSVYASRFVFGYAEINCINEGGAFQLFRGSNLFDRYIYEFLVLRGVGPECFLHKPVTCYFIHDHTITRGPMLYTCYFAEIFGKIPGVYYWGPSPIFTCKIKTCRCYTFPPQQLILLTV